MPYPLGGGGKGVGWLKRHEKKAIWEAQLQTDALSADTRCAFSHQVLGRRHRPAPQLVGGLNFPPIWKKIMQVNLEGFFPQGSGWKKYRMFEKTT